jgi:hypothetical protein
MSTLSDYIDALDDLVPGNHPVTDAKLAALRQRAIDRAIKTHSKKKPRIIVEDEAGTGAFDSVLSTALASWNSDISMINSVEYPVDDTNNDIDLLDAEEWTVYEKTSGKVLRFNSAPSTGNSFRVTYTALHTCTQAACSVDANDEIAVQNLMSEIAQLEFRVKLQHRGAA